MVAWAWGPVSERPEDADRVYLKDIAKATNQVVDDQNRQMGEEETEEEGSKGKFKVKSRKLTYVMKTFLNLKSIRSTDGVAEYKGTSYVNMEAELERVKGLCERWAVDWREHGTLARPGADQVDFTKSSEGSKELRKAWYGSEDGSKGADSEGR